MTIKNPSFKAQLLVAAGMVLLLWLSNQHFSFASPYTNEVAGDTRGYFWIATDAPELVSKKVPQHRAQRFAVPATIGVAARWLGVQEETGFYLTVLVISFAIIYRWQRLIQWCGYSGTTAIAITAMLIFNPYAFRYCFAFPGMVGDLVFIWSLLHVLDSLLKGQGIFLIFWTLIMALARQTAIVCLPAIVLGVLFLPSWNKPQRTRILYALSLVAVTGMVYQFTRSIAAPFSIPTSSWHFLREGMMWYLLRFEWDVFVVFFLRFVITFWIPLVLLLGCIAFGAKVSRSRSAKIQEGLLWLLIAGICAQPILFGPEITGGNIQRLCVFSLPAALLVLAPRLERAPCSQTGSVLRTGGLLLVLWVSSLHHLYSFWGPQIDAAAYFVGLHLVSSFVILILVFLPSGRERFLGS
jgi:hypothetical protein